MSRKKILVADDELGLQTLVKLTLGATNFDIRTASTGSEALQVAREWRPDLALLDVMMPAPNGFEVCRTLRAEEGTRTTRIIMLTALGREQDMREGVRAGADDYFNKPFSPTALLQRINELLDTPREG